MTLNDSIEQRSMKRHLQRAAGASLAAIAMSFAIAPIMPAGADATITVTTTDDVLDAGCTTITPANITTLGGDNLISLREALCAANQDSGNETIVLPAGTITITLDAAVGTEDVGAEDDFDIKPNGSVTIIGSDDGTVIDAAGVDRVFHVQSGSDATFDKLTIQNGSADLGGGIFGDLATVEITNSLVRNNTASADGGGAFLFGDTTISNSTFANNGASSSGGGIELVSDFEEASLDHVTIVGNTAGFGGGASFDDFGISDSINVSNSLIAGNSAPFAADVNAGGASFTNSVISSSELTAEQSGAEFINADATVIVATSDTPHPFTSATHTPTALADIVATELADNGGPTETFALPVGSPAIDAATVGVTTDQRGEARPLGDAPDAGAYEYNPDITDPTAGFTPAAGAQVIQGSTVTLTLDCEDETALASCVATVDGTPIADGDALPTNAAGDITVIVTATDEAGNEDTVTRTITVLAKQTLLGDYAGTTGTDGAVARLYMANFARQPDADGFNYWLDRIGDDFTLFDAANFFAGSPEFEATYGSLDNAGFVEQMYQNVLCRSGDAAGAAYWEGRLDTDLTRGDVLFFFSDSIEFQGLTGTS